LSQAKPDLLQPRCDCVDGVFPACSLLLHLAPFARACRDAYHDDIGLGRSGQGGQVRTRQAGARWRTWKTASVERCAATFVPRWYCDCVKRCWPSEQCDLPAVSPCPASPASGLYACHRRLHTSWCPWKHCSNDDQKNICMFIGRRPDKWVLQ
jgi:hypothetical protein